MSIEIYGKEQEATPMPSGNDWIFPGSDIRSPIEDDWALGLDPMKDDLATLQAGAAAIMREWAGITSVDGRIFSGREQKALDPREYYQKAMKAFREGSLASLWSDEYREFHEAEFRGDKVAMREMAAKKAKGEGIGTNIEEWFGKQPTTDLGRPDVRIFDDELEKVKDVLSPEELAILYEVPPDVEGSLLMADPRDLVPELSRVMPTPLMDPAYREYWDRHEALFRKHYDTIEAEHRVERYRRQLLDENQWAVIESLKGHISDDAQRVVDMALQSGDDPTSTAVMKEFEKLSTPEQRSIAGVLQALHYSHGGGVVELAKDAGNAFMDTLEMVLVGAPRGAADLVRRTWMDGDEYRDMVERRVLLEDANRERMNDWGYLGNTVIGVASTIPYIAAAAVPYVGMADMMLAARDQFQSEAMRNGVDVSDPSFILGSSAFAIAYAYVEKIQWERMGLGSLDKLTNLSRRQMYCDMFHSVRAALGVAGAVAGSMLTESGEEGIQRAMEVVVEKWGGATLADAVAGFTEDFVQSLGTMAILGTVGAGRQHIAFRHGALSYDKADAVAAQSRSVELERLVLGHPGEVGPLASYGRTYGRMVEHWLDAGTDADARQASLLRWGLDAEQAQTIHGALQRVWTAIEGSDASSERKEEMRSALVGGGHVLTPGEVIAQIQNGSYHGKVETLDDGSQAVDLTIGGKTLRMVVDPARTASEIDPDNAAMFESIVNALNERNVLDADGAKFTVEGWSSLTSEQRKSIIDANELRNQGDVRMFDADGKPVASMDGRALDALTGKVQLTDEALPQTAFHETLHGVLNLLTNLSTGEKDTDGGWKAEPDKDAAALVGELAKLYPAQTAREAVNEEALADAFQTYLTGKIDVVEHTGLLDRLGRFLANLFGYGGKTHEFATPRTAQQRLFNTAITGHVAQALQAAEAETASQEGDQAGTQGDQAPAQGDQAGAETAPSETESVLQGIEERHPNLAETVAMFRNRDPLTHEQMQQLRDAAGSALDDAAVMNAGYRWNEAQDRWDHFDKLDGTLDERDMPQARGSIAGMGTPNGIFTTRIDTQNKKTVDGKNTVIFRRDPRESLKLLAQAPTIDATGAQLPTLSSGAAIGGTYEKADKVALYSWIEQQVGQMPAAIKNADFGTVRLGERLAQEFQRHGIRSAQELEAFTKAPEILSSLVHFAASPNEDKPDGRKRRGRQDFFEYGLARIALSDGEYIVMGEIGIAADGAKYYDQRLAGKVSSTEKAVSDPEQGPGNTAELPVLDGPIDNRYSLLLQAQSEFESQKQAGTPRASVSPPRLPSPEFAMDGTIADALPAHLREDARAIIAERANTPAWMVEPDGTPTDLNERDWLRREAEKRHEVKRFAVAHGNNLIAVHYLSADDYFKVVDADGKLVAPSISISDAKFPRHWGSAGSGILLAMKPEVVDASNPDVDLFGADAGTPMVNFLDDEDIKDAESTVEKLKELRGQEADNILQGVRHFENTMDDALILAEVLAARKLGGIGKTQRQMLSRPHQQGEVVRLAEKVLEVGKQYGNAALNVMLEAGLENLGKQEIQARLAAKSIGRKPSAFSKAATDILNTIKGIDSASKEYLEAKVYRAVPLTDAALAIVGSEDAGEIGGDLEARGVKVVVADTQEEVEAALKTHAPRFAISGLYTGSAADYAQRDEDGNIVNGPSLHYVGRGTGSSYYGWGLYATSDKNGANTYANKVSGQTEEGRPYRFRNKKNGWTSTLARMQQLGLADSDGSLTKKAIREGWIPIAPIGPHVIYEQTFFANRTTPEETERHLLDWDTEVPSEQLKWVKNAIEEVSDDKIEEFLDKIALVESDDGIITGEALYQALSETLGSPQGASELLVKADIDGIKFNDNSVNYVSFRDDNIRVDHKWVGGEQRYQIAGRAGAERLGIRGLGDAEAMERSGATREEIWRETGWWRGADGKWRVEIPDVRLADDWKEKVKAGCQLRDIVSGPVLGAYDNAIGGVWVSVDESLKGSGTAGVFNIRHGTIRLNPNETKSKSVFLTTLAHEVQHTIQWEEGLEMGTSLAYQMDVRERQVDMTAFPKAWWEYERRNREFTQVLSNFVQSIAEPWLRYVHDASIDEKGRVKFPYETTDEIPRVNGRMIRSLSDIAKGVEKKLNKWKFYDIGSLARNGDLADVLRRVGADDFGWFLSDAMKESFGEEYTKWAADAQEAYVAMAAEAAAGIEEADAVVKEISRPLDEAFADARDAYNNAGGEVEARMVEARLGLTEEQRKVIPPWVTEAVVRQDTLTKQSDYSYAAQSEMMERMASGRHSVAPRGAQKEAGTEYPDAGAEIGGARFAVGSGRRAEYGRLLQKHRPDLDAGKVLSELDKYGNPKKEKAALHWVVRGTVILPEDEYKVDDALAVAEKAKVDPFAYDSPMALLQAHKEFRPPTHGPIDPDTVPELSDKRDVGHGVTTYLVQDDEAGQKAMREILNAAYGKDFSPWCLLHGDGKGGLSNQAWSYWHDTYNSLPKRVAFQNGKPIAFMATRGDYRQEQLEITFEEETGLDAAAHPARFKRWMRENGYSSTVPEQWWDTNDNSHEGIPALVPVEGDPLGRVHRAEIQGDGTLEDWPGGWERHSDGIDEEWAGYSYTRTEKTDGGQKKTTWYFSGGVGHEETIDVEDTRGHEIKERLVSASLQTNGAFQYGEGSREEIEKGNLDSHAKANLFGSFEGGKVTFAEGSLGTIAIQARLDPATGEWDIQHKGDIGEAELRRKFDAWREKFEALMQRPADSIGPEERNGRDNGDGRDGRRYSIQATVIQEEGLSHNDAVGIIAGLRGKSYVNRQTGIEARLSSHGAGKLVSNAAVEKTKHNGFTAKQHNAIAAKIDILFQDALLAEDRLDKAGDVNVKSIKRFVSPITIGTTDAVAWITVKESVGHGHRIYSVEGIKIAALSPSVKRVLADNNSADSTAGQTQPFPGAEVKSEGEGRGSVAGSDPGWFDLAGQLAAAEREARETARHGLAFGGARFSNRSWVEAFAARDKALKIERSDEDYERLIAALGLEGKMTAADARESAEALQREVKGGAGVIADLVKAAEKKNFRQTVEKIVTAAHGYGMEVGANARQAWERYLSEMRRTAKGRDAADFTNDTGWDLAELLWAANEAGFELQRKGKPTAAEGAPQATGVATDEEMELEAALIDGREGDLGLTAEEARERLRKLAEERMGDVEGRRSRLRAALEAWRKSEAARIEKLRAEREAKEAAKATAEADANAGMDDRADAEGKHKGERPEEENEDEAVEETPDFKAFCERLKAEGLDLENPGEIAYVMRWYVEDWMAKKSGKAPGEVLKDPVAAAQYRRTVVQLLRDAANKLLDPNDGMAAKTVERMIGEIPGDANANEIQSRSRSIIGFIKRNAIRQSRKQLVKGIQDDIQKQGIKGKKFDETEKDIGRKITGEREAYCRYLKRILNWGERKIAAEQQRLNDIITGRQEAYKAARGDDAALEALAITDREIHRATERLNALQLWGGLRTKSPAEIARAGKQIHEWLERERDEHEKRWSEWMSRNDEMAARFAQAVSASMGEYTPDDPGYAGQFADSLKTNFRSRLEELAVGSGAEGRRIIDELMMLVYEGSERRRVLDVERRQRTDAMLARCVEGTGQTVGEFLKSLDEAIPEELNRVLATEEQPTRMTWGQALQLLGSLEQTASYKRNIEENGRGAVGLDGEEQTPHRDLILQALADKPQMLRLVEEMRKIYDEDREAISREFFAVTGNAVLTPDPLYLPAKMHTGARDTLETTVRAWNPFGPAFTPRIANKRDFDLSASIMDVYNTRMKETATALAFGMRGMELRSVLARKSVQEAIARTHGKFALRKMIAQLTDIVSDGYKGDGGQLEGIRGLVRTVGNLTTYSALSWNVVTMLKQMTSIPAWTALLDGGYGEIFRHIVHFDAAAAKELMAAPGFTARYGAQSFARMFRQELENPQGGNVLARLYKAGMTAVQMGDFVPGILVGSGVYKARKLALMRRGMQEGAAREQAARETWGLIEENQQSSRLENTPEILRRGGFIGRQLSKFASSPMMQVGHEVHTLRMWMAEARLEARHGGKESGAVKAMLNAKGDDARRWRKRFVNQFICNHVLMPAAMYAIATLFKAALGGEPPDREEVYGDLVMQMVAGPWSRIFLIGAVADQTGEWAARMMGGKPNVYSRGDLAATQHLHKGLVQIGRIGADVADMDWESCRDDFVKMVSSYNAPFRYAATAVQNATGYDPVQERRRRKRELAKREAAD